MANSITTIKRREKFAAADAGITPLPRITHIAWGTGGHSPDTLQPIPPTSDVNVLPGEFLRRPVTPTISPSTTVNIIDELVFTEGAEKTISCVGLIDADGDLAAWKTFAPKKLGDADESLEIAWKEQF